ncbi:MAG TPA: hypothetical protein VFU14_02005 [Acidimicrobiales bacterium]|nr:hypothetical protein [Acidimicrobiales bacterium]
MRAPSATPPDGRDPAPAHRGRWVQAGRVLLGVLLAVLVAEGAVRAAADRLPDPQRWSTPETQYKVDQIAGRAGVRTVAVGSSVVDVALDPEALGPDAYNAALGAASIGMVDTFTRQVVVPRLDPEVVVVGVSSRELNRNAPEQRRIEADFLDAPAVRELLATESTLDTAERVAGEVSALVRYRSVLRDPESWLDPQPAWDDTVTSADGLYLGFLEESYEAGPAVLRRLRRGPLHAFEVGDRQVATLRALLSDLRSQGRRVLLVATPVTRDYVDLLPGGQADHERFTALAERVARRAGAEFVDAGVWPERLMADPLHVNRAGVQRFSDLIATALA